MLSYAIRRILGAIPTLFIIITIAFFMMRLAPGGPFDGARRLPPEIERNIAAAYNLDKPLYEQYFIYLGRLLHGDFGPSFKVRDFSVSELIMQGFPVSLRLGLLAITLAMVVGTTLGVIAALRQNRPTDYSVMSLAMIGICIPSFVTAPLLQLIFGIYGIHLFGLDLSLPVGGWNNGAARNMVLPVMVLSLAPTAVIARLTRGSMVEVLRSNFIRTARAKGWPARALKGRRLLADAWARLFRNKAAVAGMGILATVALMAIFAPMLSPYAFSDQDYNTIGCAPSWWPGQARCYAGGAHWFGTDGVGRDLFVRTLYGARISMAVGLVATLVSLAIGVLYGATAGFVGGRVDAVMMRTVDILYSLPFIFFVIILMVTFNQNFILLFVAIGAVSWLTMARIVRGQTLSAKQKELVEAARATDAGSISINTHNNHPTEMCQVLVYGTLSSSFSIL